MPRLEEIRKRCERGNPYPVRVVGRNVRTSVENFVVISPDDFAATAYVANPDDAELYAHCNEDIPYLLSLVEKQQQALEAIATALAEPAGGEFWTARKLADEWGIYHEDLDGERVLLRLAEKALALDALEEK